MSSGFTKLFGSIIHSTIWQETLETKVVWITMLALANRDGVVGASVPGLAKAAGVSIEECERALAKFLAPDTYSRTKDNDGRRIAIADGGWVLLNAEAYRHKMSAEHTAELALERKRRQRNRGAKEEMSRDVTLGHAESRDVTQSHRCHDIAEAEAEAEAEERSQMASAADAAPPAQSDFRLKAAQPKSKRKLQVPEAMTDTWEPDPLQVAALAAKFSVTEDRVLAQVKDFIWYWTKGDGADKRRKPSGWAKSFSHSVDRAHNSGTLYAGASRSATGTTGEVTVYDPH